MPALHTPFRRVLAVSILVLLVLGAALWPELIFPSIAQRYLPHLFSYLGDPRLLPLYVISDSVIWLSYMAISITLVYFLWHNRQLLPFRGIFVAFSLFLVACGLTHLVEAIVFWRPLYWLAGEAKLVTAVLSLVTACILPPLLPRLRALLLSAHGTRVLEARFIAAVEGGSDAFYILEALRNASNRIVDFTYVFLNRNVERLALLPEGDHLGKSLYELPMAGGAVTFLELFRLFTSVMLTGEPQTREFQQQPPNRAPSWIRMQVVRLADGVAITASDITAQKRSEELALHMAHHDPLTGLPNRNLMDERLQRALDRADRYAHKVAVFLIDLDSFKRINDDLGHATGDQVLVVSAKRLKHSIRNTDSVLRLGGDEFVVVLPDIHNIEDVERVAAKILPDLAQAIDHNGITVQISCSIGICIYPDSATTAEQLLQNADAAMYQAKRNGGNQFASCRTARRAERIKIPSP